MLRLAVLAFLLAGADPAFDEFISWYKTYQGSFMPPEVMKAYTAKLKSDGVDAAEVQRRLGSIGKSISGMPVEFAALHFDRIYSAPQPPFKDAASQFLARAIEGRKPGRALDVAMGQGRNTLFLASQGWDATGYDISEGGMALARTRAAKLGLKLNAVRASHDEFDYGHEQWDLIVECYAFTNLSDAAYRKRVMDSLKPGGMLVIEGFGGGNQDVFVQGFKGLRFILYEDREDIADWGMQKQRLQKLAAVKE